MGEWVHKKLGDLGEIITGSTPSTSKLEYWKGDYNFYSPADFTENVYCYKTERTVTLEGMNVGRCIPINSIMVACIASIGKIAINKTEGITNQQINTIVPLKDYNYLFLYYMLLHNSSIIKNGAAQTTIPIINKEDFSNLEFAIPISLSEQRRIASILSSADKVIDSTQKLIAKYKSIKQGMMEDLLKPKEGWKKVKLGEVGEPSSEKYNPMTENIFQYCIEMENINQESGTINGKSDITKLLSLKTKFHKGDVLYGKLRPYLRKYWLADFDGACSTEIWVLKNAENIDKQFLFYLFQSEYINKIANLSSGTKMPRADWKFMKEQKLYIPYKNGIPDVTEQRRIASILSGIDKKIEAEEKVLEKYKKVKKGLMEKLLKVEE